jgi:hypothetical protein
VLHQLRRQDWGPRPGGQALVNITNSCLRSYTDAGAVSKYGAVSSALLASFGWADNFQGEIRMTNVLIHGGRRGMAIYADTGTDAHFVRERGAYTYKRGGSIEAPVGDAGKS